MTRLAIATVQRTSPRTTRHDWLVLNYRPLLHSRHNGRHRSETVDREIKAGITETPKYTITVALAVVLAFLPASALTRRALSHIEALMFAWYRRRLSVFTRRQYHSSRRLYRHLRAVQRLQTASHVSPLQRRND